MAAMVSPWGKPGAWALDSEQHEAELEEQQQQQDNSNNHSNSEFPSLATAAATKANKKNKPQTLSLQEFTSSSYKPTQGPTPLDLLSLPTGPRQRSAEELDRSRLGGGFRSYGSSNRDDSRWGSSRATDEPPRRQGGFGRDSSSREFAPSRADEIDDWGATKKSTVGNGFERRDRGDKPGSGFGFSSDSQSRADGSDSWVSNKGFVPSEGRRFGSGGGGGGGGGSFDSIRERRGSGGGFESNGGGADSDNWGKKKQEEGRRFGASSGSAFDSLRERRGSYESAADSQNWGRKREEGTGAGRPKLNLQPRTLPVGEGQQNGSAKPKVSSPFGDARPREEVLKEKGHDWKEIDEKLESTKIKETVSAEGNSFQKRGFGSSDGRGASLPEDRAVGSWRKSETVDAPSPSLETVEGGIVKESEDGSLEM